MHLNSFARLSISVTYFKYDGSAPTRRECKNAKNDSHRNLHILLHVCICSSSCSKCVTFNIASKMKLMVFSVCKCTLFTWYSFLSVQRIIIFEPLQWFEEFSRNGEYFYRTVHINSKTNSKTLAWWTSQVRTFRVLRMKVNSFQLFSHHGKFFFYYKYMNCHCFVYALNAPRGYIDCNLWTKLKQKKHTQRTHQQHFEITLFLLSGDLLSNSALFFKFFMIL